MSLSLVVTGPAIELPPSVFTAGEVLAIGTACLLAYAAACLLLRKNGASALWWCAPIALLLSVTYALNLHDLWAGTLYAGIKSDQATNLGYTQNVISGNYFGDLYEKHVPAMYPPLYFWVLGTAARWIGWSGFEIWRYSPILILLLLPFVVYAIGARAGGHPRCGFYACFALFALGSYHSAHFYGFNSSAIDPFTLQMYLLSKPYEVLGALLLVWWLLSFGRGPSGGVVTARWLAGQGVIGAGVFLLYSPWFTIGALALIAHGLLGKGWTPRFRYLGWLAVVGALTTLLTSVHWFPFVRYLLEHGREHSVGTGHFLSGHMDVTWVTTGMGFFGGCFLLALPVLRRPDPRPGVLALVLGIGVTYAWYLSTYVTFPLFGHAFLPHRCHALLTVMLPFAAAIGIDRLRGVLARIDKEHWVSPFALALIAALMLPSFLRWNIRTDPQLACGENRLSRDHRELLGALSRPKPLTLVSCLGPEPFYAVSLTRTRLFLSPNLSHGNPLIRHRVRVATIRYLAETAQDSAALAAGFDTLGVDAILLRNPDESPLILDVWHRPTRSTDLQRTMNEWPSLLASTTFGAPPGKYWDPALNKEPGANGEEDHIGEIVFRRRLLMEPEFERAFDNGRRVLFVRCR